jgi:hypothetical protein
MAIFLEETKVVIKVKKITIVRVETTIISNRSSSKTIKLLFEIIDNEYAVTPKI